MEQEKKEEREVDLDGEHVAVNGENVADCFLADVVRETADVDGITIVHRHFYFIDFGRFHKEGEEAVILSPNLGVTYILGLLGPLNNLSR